MRRLLCARLLCLLPLIGCGDDDLGTSASAGSETTGSSSASSGGAGGEGGQPPQATCGDGKVEDTEGCDDGGTDPDDGCDVVCAVEPGYSCDGEPSECTVLCGDGATTDDEECDDGDARSGDGCDPSCAVEHGYSCDGEPSACASTCGDGLVASDEPCDDGNDEAGDGCGSCLSEPGYSCAGEPSACATICGDGLTAGSEACDDAGTTANDGCSATCALELGWSCSGEPSVCEQIGTCASPIVASAGFVFAATNPAPFGDDNEQTDATCAVPDNASAGHPDLVFQIDLLLGQRLHLSDYGSLNVLLHVLDGACGDATACAASFDGDNVIEEQGYDYLATTDQAVFVVVDSWEADPTTSETIDIHFEIGTCGDSTLEFGEACDDGDGIGGDGCSATCEIEAGYTCTGSPSDCTSVPGSVCSNAIDVSDGFAFAGPDIYPYGNELGFVESSCGYNTALGCDMVFALDLVEDQWARVTSQGTQLYMFALEVDTCASLPECMASIYAGNGTTPLSFQASESGTYYIVLEEEACSSSNAIPFDVHFEVSTCGDGDIELGESCDDSNGAAGDGCSPECDLEPGYSCTGAPSTCDWLQGAACVNPILASDGFVFTDTISKYMDDLDFHDSSCTAVSVNSSLGGASYTSPEMVFALDLVEGQWVEVTEHSGPLVVIMHALDTNTCSDEAVCAASVHANDDVSSLSFRAEATGTHYVVVESFSSSPSSALTAEVHFEVSTCGDGAAELGEPCDDGNVTDGDGCSAACSVEPGYSCSGAPSTCTWLEGAACVNAIVASDGFVFAGDDISPFYDDLDFTDSSCYLASGPPFNSAEIVFSIDLAQGQRVKVTEHTSLDVVMHALPVGVCQTESMCYESATGSEAGNGLRFGAEAAGTYYVVVESFSEPPSATPGFDVHFEISICGDGIVELQEPCDDGNSNDGDGCSAVCDVEAGYTCSGSPSTCM